MQTALLDLKKIVLSLAHVFIFGEFFALINVDGGFVPKFTGPKSFFVQKGNSYVFFSEVSKVNIHGLFIRANICCDQFYPKYLDVKIEIRSVDLDKCHLSRNLKVHGKRILPLFVIPKFNCLDLCCLVLSWRLTNKKSKS